MGDMCHPQTFWLASDNSVCVCVCGYSHNGRWSLVAWLLGMLPKVLISFHRCAHQNQYVVNSCLQEQVGSPNNTLSKEYVQNATRKEVGNTFPNRSNDTLSDCRKMWEREKSGI